MKKILFPVLAIMALLQACKEKEILIPELSVGNRRVVVEEITGVGCTNCPDGARELAAVAEVVGEDNLILVAIHAGNVGGGNFSTPLSTSKYDFQTQDGYDLVAQLGDIFAVPSAAISRYQDPFDLTAWLLDSWSARITAELGEDYKVDMFVNNEYNEITRSLDIEVRIAPEVTITGDYNLTVMITQDSIVDPQKDGLETIQNYVHRHVLRDIISSVGGNQVTEPLTGGTLVTKNFSIVLPTTWDAKHCEIVAFIHGGANNTNKEALQAAKGKVID
jgi:hypothetical protein